MSSVYAFATEGQDIRKDNKEKDDTEKKVSRDRKKKPVLVDVEHGYDPRGQ